MPSSVLLIDWGPPVTLRWPVIGKTFMQKPHKYLHLEKLSHYIFFLWLCNCLTNIQSCFISPKKKTLRSYFVGAPIKKWVVQENFFHCNLLENLISFGYEANLWIKSRSFLGFLKWYLCLIWLELTSIVNKFFFFPYKH